MELNHTVKARAAKRAIAKSKRIEHLGLRADMTQEERDAIATDLATAKALENDGSKVEDFLEGQSWYVNDLCEYAGKTPTERFQHEYDDLIVVESSVEDITTMIANAAGMDESEVKAG